MTRFGVILVGFTLLIIGSGGFYFFRKFGFDSSTAGIASEAILIFIILLWISSYVFRVINGNMTFMQQRKKYRQAYEEVTIKKISEKFDSLSKEEQDKLMDSIERDF